MLQARQNFITSTSLAPAPSHPQPIPSVSPYGGGHGGGSQ